MTVEKPSKENYERRLRTRVMHMGGVAAAGVFGSILMVAYLIISGNKEEFTSPVAFITYFLLISVVITALLLVLFWILPFRLSKLIAVGLASYAVVSLILDSVLPLGIGTLELGTESAPAVPIWGTAVQVLGTLLLGYVVWRLPLALAGRLGWTLVVVIVFSIAVPVVVRTVSMPSYQPAGVIVQGEAPQYNIYHIVFDGYYSPWLQWAMEELNLDSSTFAGFTHYPAARSNYGFTYLSYPSFMSGTVYQPPDTVTEWIRNSDANSMIVDLKEAGFITSYWHPVRKDGAGFREVDYAQTEAMELPGLLRWGGDLIQVLDLWAVRAAPVVFRPLFFKGGSGLASWLFAPKIELSEGEHIRLKGNVMPYRTFQQFLSFLTAEESRSPVGEYVHLHLYPPHSPYQLDRSGEFVGESTYEEQLLLATNMMVMFLDRLRELDRLENSFIIIQSDHGAWEPAKSKIGSNRDFITIDEQGRKKIAEMEVNLELKKWGGEGSVDTRFGALLMVKPPAACVSQETKNRLQVDPSLTQLKDLREFVASVVSGDNSQCTFPSREFVDIYAGLADRSPLRITEGETNAFRIHSDGRWETLSDISIAKSLPGAVKFRVREFQGGVWTGNFVNGATAKLVDSSDSTVYATVTSADHEGEVGWVDFFSVPPGEYSILVYKLGMQGAWKQTSCEGAAATEGITVQDAATEGNIAVWQDKVSIANEIVWCRDVGLEVIP